jgi:hypothetical protein
MEVGRSGAEPVKSAWKVSPETVMWTRMGIGGRKERRKEEGGEGGDGWQGSFPAWKLKDPGVVPWGWPLQFSPFLE